MAKNREDDNHITNWNFPECEGDILDCITQHLALFEGWDKPMVVISKNIELNRYFWPG
jgi:spore cortex formation protein SpoVR/YcgB (stage V sporulation)